MISIMRTTIALPEQLLKIAKREARARGQTLGRLIESSLRRELARPTRASAAPRVPIFRGGTGVRPGIDVTSNRALLEALDEGRPIEKLR
jgi:hypothetical protein